MYSEATKKYEKVDSFLKRFLSPVRYKRVRLTEPCVVVSSEYNKLFKFVVLADDWLYITENPPKLAKDIQGITKVVNITSVELVSCCFFFQDKLFNILNWMYQIICITYIYMYIYVYIYEYLTQAGICSGKPNSITGLTEQSECTHHACIGQLIVSDTLELESGSRRRPWNCIFRNLSRLGFTKFLLL